MVSMRQMSVMAGEFVVAAFVMLGRFMMMLGGMLMMLCRLGMMLGRLLCV